MCVEFRSIRNEELDSAYQIIVDATAWLLRRGIRQWPVPFPRTLYEQAQSRGEHVGLFEEGVLLAVVTLCQTVSRDWLKETGGGIEWWLSKLAVAPAHQGRGYGRQLVQAAIQYLDQRSVQCLWLDCVHGDGTLPNYYEQLGFVRAARKQVCFSTGDFDMVLMCHHLRQLTPGCS